MQLPCSLPCHSAAAASLKAAECHRLLSGWHNLALSGSLAVTLPATEFQSSDSSSRVPKLPAFMCFQELEEWSRLRGHSTSLRSNADMVCNMGRTRHTLEARRAEAMPVRASRKEATCPSRTAASSLSFCLKAWSWMRGSKLLSSMHAQEKAP